LTVTLVNLLSGWPTAQRQSHHALAHSPQSASSRISLRPTGCCRPVIATGHSLVVSLVVEFPANANVMPKLSTTRFLVFASSPADDDAQGPPIVNCRDSLPVSGDDLTEQILARRNASPRPLPH